MTEMEIKNLMQRRIRQILIHSCIYYRFNDNIIPDHKYDAWGRELAQLIQSYPHLLSELDYGEYFLNYTETTSGFDLPLGDVDIVSRAYWLKNQYKLKG